MNEGYANHILEIAARHNLEIDPEDATSAVSCTSGLTQAVYRPAMGWCMKLHEPGSMEDHKLRAERAILGIVTEFLPVPRILGFGITQAIPNKAYQVLEWKEGRAWQDVVPKTGNDERLEALRDAGAFLGTLHSLCPPGEGEVPDIPRGNYQTWRSQNLPILDQNLAFLYTAGLLEKSHVEGIKAAVEAARSRLFQSPISLVHGDFGSDNVLVDDSTGLLTISAIIDWGNAGIDPLEADYEVVLMELLLPAPDNQGYVMPYEPNHFREMCDAFGAGYRGERGIEIDWPVMKAHSLLQWVKRCVRNYERAPQTARCLAASVRMAAVWDS
jgi:aminoglycoside phosphotransferase (APT) family kinase protein